MSKIIIDNQSDVGDIRALQLVIAVMLKGFVSGVNQYCWQTFFKLFGVSVSARKTRGKTHSFIVKNDAIEAWVQEQETDGL